MKNEEEKEEIEEDLDELYYLLALHGVSTPKPSGKKFDRRDRDEEDEESEIGAWSGVPIDLGAKRKKKRDPLIDSEW